MHPLLERELGLLKEVYGSNALETRYALTSTKAFRMCVHNITYLLEYPCIVMISFDGDSPLPFGTLSSHTFYDTCIYIHEHVCIITYIHSLTEYMEALMKWMLSSKLISTLFWM